MLGYKLEKDAYINMAANDLRDELATLARYTAELEEERDALKDERDEWRQKYHDEIEKSDAAEEDTADACDEIAEALGEFMRYNGDAGGEWYRKDARAMLDKMAGALHCLPTTRGADVEALASYTY